MHQEPQPTFNEKINGHVNLILLVCSALALPSIVFLHRDIGSRFIGPRILLSILLILIAPTFWPHSDPRPLFLFIVGIFIMCALARVSAWRRRSRGEWIHRYYDGYPRFIRFFPKRGEAEFKKFEAFIIFFVAMLLMPVCEALGGFLVCSAIGVIVSAMSAEAAVKERLEAMRDQQIENQNLIERFRSLNSKYR